VQKQPGTLAVPIIIRVHLPNNITIGSLSNGAVVQENNVLIETNLKEDREIQIVFRIP